MLWKCFGSTYCSAAPLYFIEIFIQASQGWFLARLLEWIETPNAPASTGYWLAGGIALDGLLYTLLHHSEWFISLRTGMKVRVGLITAIFRKCLNLSISNTSSTGFIVNLVSNDVQRFEDLSPFLHYAW